MPRDAVSRTANVGTVGINGLNGLINSRLIQFNVNMIYHLFMINNIMINFVFIISHSGKKNSRLNYINSRRRKSNGIV